MYKSPPFRASLCCGHCNTWASDIIWLNRLDFICPTGSVSDLQKICHGCVSNVRYATEWLSTTMPCVVRRLPVGLVTACSCIIRQCRGERVQVLVTVMTVFDTYYQEERPLWWMSTADARQVERCFGSSGDATWRAPWSTLLSGVVVSTKWVVGQRLTAPLIHSLYGKPQAERILGDIVFHSLAEYLILLVYVDLFGEHFEEVWRLFIMTNECRHILWFSRVVIVWINSTDGT